MRQRVPCGCNNNGEGEGLLAPEISTMKVITGDHAVAIGAKLCRVEVVPAFPITPQTLIIEHIADFVNDGELDAKFLTMESEHSVMSAAAAASAVGARVFTATSSQGLAFMHESKSL